MAVRNLRLNIPSYQNPHLAYDLVKRAFDIVISLIALILLAPLFGLIALAIKRDSPGPVFYRGPRLGKNGKPFNILKFRTMWEKPESYQGPRLTAQDDDRITPLGRWLRDTKLNELPQFWNVLVGEMSLVGPRPEDPTLAKTWPAGAMKEILSVRPGITSPASIQYHNEERVLATGSALQKYLQELSPDKQRMDRLYVRYRSFLLDLDTLLWTVLVLLPRLRSYSPPESLLFFGPLERLIRRYASWFALDLIISLLSIGVVGLLWHLSGPLNIGWPKAIFAAIGFASIFSAIGALYGVNRIAWSKAEFKDIHNLWPAWAIATIVTCIVNLGIGLLPIEPVLFASLLALGGFVFTRYRSRLITGSLSRIMVSRGRARVARERVLIVGTGPTAQLTAWMLNDPANLHRFWLIGFIDDDLLQQGMRIYGSKIVGTSLNVPELIRKYDIGLVILAKQSIASEEFRSLLDTCTKMSARLVLVPDILSTINGLLQAPRIVQSPGQKMSKRFESPCLHCLARGISLEVKSQMKTFCGAMTPRGKARKQLVPGQLQDYPLAADE